MSQTFLALGSNLGDRLVNLQHAIALLPPEVLVLAQSLIYETEPWGYADQPCFLNQVVQAETQLSPPDLLTYLKAAEVDLGREPGVRYGPRVIDLDILFYNDLVLESQGLTIPHPRLHERAFVLVPLADIAPDIVHPVYRLTVAELLTKVDTTGVNPFDGSSY